MKVTRPIFPAPAKAFTTARLLIRPIIPDDVVEFHILRTQPEVMIFTSSGKVDVDTEATSIWVKRFTHPNDTKTFSFAIEELDNPGTIVGTVGSHVAEPPTLGYMFRKEFWGKGYATEALKGWMEEYWKLPRREIEHSDSLPEVGELKLDDNGAAREVLVAEVESENKASSKIMEKCGFKPTGVQEQVEDFRGPAVIVHYYIERPSRNSE
jgi:RimJ/RimL family protein N-acetyltransferase